VTGTGVLPPTVASTTYLGKLLYDDSAIVRDLGFSGVVNGQIIWTFGDTLLLTGDGSTSEFCSSDSSGLGVFGSPLVVHDKALCRGHLRRARSERIRLRTWPVDGEPEQLRVSCQGPRRAGDGRDRVSVEGPWTHGFTVASTCPNDVCGDERYAIAPHPEYDPTGKTVFVTWTASNSIYGVKIEWQ